VERLLIVGASGRAAAASARRAGFEPFVLDLFADADTERLATVLKLPMDEYPHGFVELAQRVPPMPWMYTGGLENYPDVVAAISETRELRGYSSHWLGIVRNPSVLWLVLSGSGFDAPVHRVKASKPGDIGQWIRKPIRGSAGFGISMVEATHPDSEDHYIQQFISGESVSAIYRKEQFVGLSRQLVGIDWLHAKPFRYSGSIGPISAGRYHSPSFRNLGEFLAERHFASELFGLDMVFDGERCHVVEMNPRYTASAEVFELATRKSIFADESPLSPTTCIGKAIYYAPHRIVFPASGPWDDSLARCTDVWRRPDYADIPHAGDVIETGHPVITIFAEAPDEAECEAALRSRAAELDLRFRSTDNTR
jgi:uncharacterized protein